VAPKDIKDAAEAALGLKPFGQYAFLLFSAGLLNASVFAASHSAALHGVFGVRRAWASRPASIGACAKRRFSISSTRADRGRRRRGAASEFPAGKNDPALAGAERRAAAVHSDLHGDADQQEGPDGRWVNPRWFNLVSWITVVIMIGITAALVAVTIKGT
jgi:Mn2+/Fe2+ NRAMP family transporter